MPVAESTQPAGGAGARGKAIDDKPSTCRWPINATGRARAPDPEVVSAGPHPAFPAARGPAGRRQHRRDLVEAPRGGTPVRLDQRPGGGPQLGAAARVGQQLGQHRRQLAGRRDPAGGPVGEEQLGDLGEVLHVRPEHHRPAPRRRLDHIVPARGHQAPPDEDDGSRPEQRGQLAHRVEHDDLDPARAVVGRPAAAHRREPPPGRQRGRPRPRARDAAARARGPGRGRGPAAAGRRRAPALPRRGACSPPRAPAGRPRRRANAGDRRPPPADRGAAPAAHRTSGSRS